MLAWERQPDESARAYQGFCCYRDYGPQRSLAKVGQELGKSRALIERWSSQHDWVDRVAALEARDEMLKREGVEEHIRAGAEDRARREAALLELDLEIREIFGEQARFMARWPSVEQRRVVEDGPDGETVTYVYLPAKWTKSTAIQMHAAMLGSRSEPEPDDELLDWGVLDDQETEDFLRSYEKVLAAPRLTPEQAEARDRPPGPH